MNRIPRSRPAPHLAPAAVAYASGRPWGIDGLPIVLAERCGDAFALAHSKQEAGAEIER